MNLNRHRRSPIASEEQKSYKLKLKDGKVFDCGAVSMGNPHVVLFFDKVDAALVSRLGPQIECHPDFPQKVNVGFAQVLTPHHLKLAVFERGCGPTLACGTGACAAAVVGIVQGKLQSPVKVSLPGGDLKIVWDGVGKSVMMSGPAERVYEGTICI